MSVYVIFLRCVSFCCPPGSEGEELHPLQDRGEHQEEDAGLRQRVQTPRRPSAADRQQQDERGAAQHAGDHHVSHVTIHDCVSFSPSIQ